MELTIKTKAPVAFSLAPTGNINRTMDYLPGTAIRGALAKRFLASHDLGKTEYKQLFERLFLSDSVIFGNAYPKDSFPIPLTARACKVLGGFKRRSGQLEEKYHGVKDFLIELLVYEKSLKWHSLNSFTLPDECTVNNCRSPMESYSCWCLYNIKYDCYEETAVNKRDITRTEILPSTQSAMENRLYSREVIEVEQVFSGSIITHETELKDELKVLLDDKKFYLGVGQTRGLGEVEIADDDTPVSTLNPFLLKPEDDRIGKFEEFNSLLQQRFSETDLTTEISYFSITMLSDLILQNKYGQYLSQLPVDILISCLKAYENYEILNQFTLVSAFSGSHEVTGWSDVWKLPKHSELAISKGSVFLYESKQKVVDSEKDDLVNLLSELDNKRIGNRINEGFGHISVCDPFHWKDLT